PLGMRPEATLAHPAPAKMRNRHRGRANTYCDRRPPVVSCLERGAFAKRFKRVDSSTDSLARDEVRDRPPTLHNLRPRADDYHGRRQPRPWSVWESELSGVRRAPALRACSGAADGALNCGIGATPMATADLIEPVGPLFPVDDPELKRLACARSDVSGALQ